LRIGFVPVPVAQRRGGALSLARSFDAGDAFDELGRCELLSDFIERAGGRTYSPASAEIGAHPASVRPPFAAEAIGSGSARVRLFWD
jgi:hypothetical protein